ncbi:MAG: TetR/AcrR family transcriptional regulator [Corynebacteriales bacterium]|uniref:TetR/AcrR family transcriptional regulator n=2 Tax=Williamsia TaxID=85043 RepID=A0AAU4K2K2_9NOCA|nr:TetR/AcrR family transcriptional regulator [Williamsia herbipolensis]MCX6471189.1 TetR/AcrR family transcriptional regulator [Mycobacteriales bacterium]
MFSTLIAMTQAKRTRMSPEARREQLISHGMSMLSDRPLDQLTIDAIAESVGVSRALLFHYFESKHDFHVAIAREQSRRMLECTEPDLSLEDPIAILRASMSEFVDYVSANRHVYLTMLRGAVGADPAMQEVFTDTRRVMAQRVLDRAGSLDITPTPMIRIAVDGWMAFVEEVVVAWLTDDDGIRREALLDLITSSLPLLAAAAASE